MSQLRQQVLSSFRQLHRLRARVFKNDSVNLRESRDMMNSIYKQNSGLTDEVKIKEELVNAHESYKAISALLRVEQKDENTNKICGFNEHTAWNDNYAKFQELFGSKQEIIKFGVKKGFRSSHIYACHYSMPLIVLI